ncbi:hypothetical protein [Solimonas aquatica]|uniref:hypothetical protein n=1 Tax=Solimonas aquatica TaxID=489703 RepID=UPI001160666D|nr:hypothetical protein [Solimonas aquatica]
MEVGSCDGLQNEPGQIDCEPKLELIKRMADSGLRHIEATASVSPKWVPQMADHSAVMCGVHRDAGVRYSVLTPHLQGFEAAVAAQAPAISFAVYCNALRVFAWHRHAEQNAWWQRVLPGFVARCTPHCNLASDYFLVHIASRVTNQI